MRQYLRICASAVCVPKKPQKNTLSHKRHHPKTNVPQCSFVYLCICVFPKEITALIKKEDMRYEDDGARVGRVEMGGFPPFPSTSLFSGAL